MFRIGSVGLGTDVGRPSMMIDCDTPQTHMIRKATRAYQVSVCPVPSSLSSVTHGFVYRQLSIFWVVKNTRSFKLGLLSNGLSQGGRKRLASELAHPSLDKSRSMLVPVAMIGSILTMGALG